MTYGLVMLAVFFGPMVEAGDLSVSVGPGQAGPVTWQEVSFEYQVGPAGGWQARLVGLAQHDGTYLGDWTASCAASPEVALPGCELGQLNWRLDEDIELTANFSVAQGDDEWQVAVLGRGWELAVNVPEQRPADVQAAAVFRDFDLSLLPKILLAPAGLTLLEGRLNGQARWPVDDSLNADFQFEAVNLDTEDGLIAAEGLGISLELNVSHLEQNPHWSGKLSQHAGEVLAGPVYLPAPQQPLRLEFAGRLDGSQQWRFSRLDFTDPGALAITGSALFEVGDDGPGLTALELGEIEVKLPAFWQRWAEGPAGQVGFGDLQTQGAFRGRASWSFERGWAGNATVDRLDLFDPSGRVKIEGFSGSLGWEFEGSESDLSWDELEVYGLPFGSSRLRLKRQDAGLVLLAPLEMPLLDGAVVVDQLSWQRGDDETAGLRMDARIRPLSLTRLTRQLGWPEFGGQLSGEFPGIKYADERLGFSGGILVKAFSGTIALDELAIERPFGTLPALSAQVQISRLDLLELTGAFNFGRMEGQASGWMRDLRLLDWRPVRMDTRLFTHEDVPRRRISQRAVENLSSLGGAGGALMTGTVLRVFEDFPYRRAGLACRLANNICHIDGVARHESGGFYIVEGRALPRLDIIGHRRLVDWPQLVAQLEAMMD